MANNYTVYEAIDVLRKQEDYEKITEIHRRFPYLADFAIRVLTKAPAEFAAFASYLPEYLTASKVNNVMKKHFENAEAAEDVKPDENPDEKEEVKEDSKSVDYFKMPAGKLKEMIKERGLEDACRNNFGRINHDNMAKTLEAFDAGKISVNVEEPEVEEGETEEDGAGKYDGIPAMKLFKMCKERGIKAKPKQPAKFYVELLEDDDAKSEPEVEDEDDWDDPLDEDINASLPDAIPAKEDDDDDDDWDI